MPGYLHKSIFQRNVSTSIFQKYQSVALPRWFRPPGLYFLVNNKARRRLTSGVNKPSIAYWNTVQIMLQFNIGSALRYVMNMNNWQDNRVNQYNRPAPGVSDIEHLETVRESMGIPGMDRTWHRSEPTGKDLVLNRVLNKHPVFRNLQVISPGQFNSVTGQVTNHYLLEQNQASVHNAVFTTNQYNIRSYTELRNDLLAEYVRNRHMTFQKLSILSPRYRSTITAPALGEPPAYGEALALNRTGSQLYYKADHNSDTSGPDKHEPKVSNSEKPLDVRHDSPAAAMPDIDRLVDRVYNEIERKIKLEKERLGL